MADGGRSGAHPATGLPDRARIAWTAETGFPVHGTPVLAGDTLLAGDSAGRVHAFDAATGERRWRSPDEDCTPGPGYDVFTTAVDVWRDQVVVGVCDGTGYFDGFADAGHDEELDDGEVGILDLRSGALLRKVGRGGYPAVVGDTLLLIGLNSGVRALGLPDLTPLWWNRKAEGCVQTAPAAGPDDLLCLPCGWEGNRTHGGILALDLRTGKRRFRYSPREESYGDNPPHATVAEGLIWKPVHRATDEIVGLDPLTRKPRWRHRVRQAAPNGSVAVADGRVYFTTRGDGPAVHAVDIETREEAWTRSLPAAGVGTPVFAAGAVYTATSKGTVLALDAATGEPRWTLDTGLEIDLKEPNDEALYEETASAVLPADGMLYVRTATGVVALR
ncbi:PQQ-binding-like beta-propeller repeat protein [Actinomadura kijaniata]|uniref:PQQ-binding-like beta-propeller repeat protein n=1 Tax=Actinomadura kijaniata TaxID=46161 RepID=UPI00082CD2DF|nr:PQQ-binding-like beta-propeller repeat protein [Actinomadura kijaniata]